MMYLLLQVVFLQYCRGSNTGRTNASEQEMDAMLMCKRIKRTPPNYSDQFTHTDADHSWGTVALPDNYYVAFSSLSDSKYV